MSRLLNVSFSENDVKSLREKSVFPENVMVINPAVTARIRRLQAAGYDDIVKAGVSGLREKEGIISNRPGLFFSNKYSGKMEGMVGLSGFAGNNSLCLRRAIAGTKQENDDTAENDDFTNICGKCFSFLTPWWYSLLAWTRNDVILSTVKIGSGDVIIDPALIPYTRYSSHGDLINGLHAYNYLRIAADNPDVKFGFWTKNAGYYREGLEMFGGPRPENLTVNFSPINTNVIPSASSLQAAKAAGIDGIFSVFTDREKQAAAINAGAYFCKCGPGSCRHNCLFCYSQKTRRRDYDASKAVLIAEILDGERHKGK